MKDSAVYRPEVLLKEVGIVQMGDEDALGVLRDLVRVAVNNVEGLAVLREGELRSRRLRSPANLEQADAQERQRHHADREPIPAVKGSEERREQARLYGAKIVEVHHMGVATYLGGGSYLGRKTKCNVVWRRDGCLTQQSGRIAQQAITLTSAGTMSDEMASYSYARSVTV